MTWAFMWTFVLPAGVGAASDPSIPAASPKASSPAPVKPSAGPEAYQSSLAANPAAALQFSLDSAQRDMRRKILSDVDKKEIRTCEREKSLALKQCRDAQATRAGLEYNLNQAKLKGGDPNDPVVQSTMEQLFGLEKACDDQYNATPRAKQCLSGEQKRQAALEKVLAADKAYQGLLKKSKSTTPEKPQSKASEAL